MRPRRTTWNARPSRYHSVVSVQLAQAARATAMLEAAPPELSAGPQVHDTVMTLVRDDNGRPPLCQAWGHLAERLWGPEVSVLLGARVDSSHVMCPQVRHCNTDDWATYVTSRAVSPAPFSPCPSFQALAPHCHRIDPTSSEPAEFVAGAVRSQALAGARCPICRCTPSMRSFCAWRRCSSRARCSGLSAR